MSGDGGGDRVVSPVREAHIDEETCRDEAGDANTGPQHFGGIGLGRGNVAHAVDGGGLQKLTEGLHYLENLLLHIYCNLSGMYSLCLKQEWTL